MTAQGGTGVGKRAVGRPKKYATADELSKAVQDYFDSLVTATGKFKRAPSVAGLCLYLGISRSTWYAYADDADLEPVVEGARLTVEDFWVNQLAGKFANGAKFALGCGFGWNERGRWNEKDAEAPEEDDGHGVVEIGRVMEAPEAAQLSEEGDE